MSVFRLVTRKLTSTEFDARAGQIAAWTVSALVLVLGLLKLASLQLTETQLLFGVMLVLAVSLLGVNLGLMLPIAQSVNELRKRREDTA